ncbi:MAG: tetratricopeptide repeat protein, partial [Planctomycetaceae bacterium]|nr:tetratricopeptide repeat protein [Planctomycetaceae bacterium]
IQKSVLSTFLVACLLLGLGKTLRTPTRFRWWLATGLSVGLLSLVRENALILPAAILTWIAGFPRNTLIFSRRDRLRAATLVLAGFMAALAPALVRNRMVGGEWRLTTAQFGPNFYIGNSAEADGTYQELIPEHGTPTHEQADATAIAEEETSHTLTPGEVSAWWTDRTLTDIHSDPARWGRLLLQKVCLTWTNAELADSEDQYTAAEESLVLRFLTYMFPFGVLAGLAAFGLVQLGSRWRRYLVLPLLLVAYTASIALFYLFARYRLPLVPILALLCGAGVMRTLQLWRQRNSPEVRALRTRFLAAAGVGVIVGLLTSPRLVGTCFANWPDISVARQRAVTEFNLGLRLWDREAPLDEVEPHFAAATTWYPEYASAWLFWGRVLVDHKQFADALPKLQQAARYDPDGADILQELGAALLLAGRPAEAVDPLVRSVELDPSDSESQYLLGRSLHLTGRKAEAVVPLQTAIKLETNHIAARRLLAITLDQLGQSAEAEEQFSLLLRQMPDDAPEAELIRRRLRKARSPLRKQP